MDARDTELRRELDATLQTRRELGREYDDELISAFLEKFDKHLETVVDDRMRRQAAEVQMAVARGGRPPAGTASPSYPRELGGRLTAVVSLVLAVPLSAIAAANTGLSGLLVCWAGLVGVNAVHAHGIRSILPGADGRLKPASRDR